MSWFDYILEHPDKPWNYMTKDRQQKIDIFIQTGQ